LSTNLKLLLDECVSAPLEEMLRQSSAALNIESIRELGMSGTDDAGVIDYAVKNNRIVVTTETAMNHKKYKICRHPGIIVIGGRRRHEAAQAEFFRKFMLSGHRAETHHAVTFLSESEARIKTSNDSSVPDKIIKL
jgi:predicted nuclease of predicted toxin-antitoxin system